MVLFSILRAPFLNVARLLFELGIYFEPGPGGWVWQLTGGNMPNIAHVLFLQVVVVVGLAAAVAEGAPCRRHHTTTEQQCGGDAVSFHRHQRGQVDNSNNNRVDLDISYLDIAAAPLAAPPTSGFNTDRIDRWEDRDFVDKNMEEELERWYEQWNGRLSYDDDDNDYDGDDGDNDYDFRPYPTTTYPHHHHHLFIKRTASLTKEDFSTLYPYTSLLFHLRPDIPPPPPSKQLTYPPPRPLSSLPGSSTAPAPALSLSPFSDTLTPSQSAALESLHREHIAQFAVLSDKFREEVAITKEKHAKTIADILGVPTTTMGVEVDGKKGGRRGGVDLERLSVQQTRELAVYAGFVEFEFRGLFQRQMGERVGLLRRQRGEWEGLVGVLGVVVGGEQQVDRESKKNVNVYWGGLDEGEVSWFGEWLEKRGEGEEEEEEEEEEIGDVPEWWMGKSRNRKGVRWA
ncbi:hypothetical protein B0T21DRAFT_454048 [Apiosordaria backusii]|uniref:Uncharacterized protein n=1 Tax=Apiosordaria backusii TaxID=314023 RepID=A0AA40AN53_9PEZI|nr:hypothetical protein B0T21DRAFT_454048 [Apiosordaria backusii]